MLKYATLLLGLLFCGSAYSAEPIQEKLEYVSAKFETLNQLGSACDSQLTISQEKGIDSEECKKYLKIVKSTYYTSAIEECEKLLDYYDKNRLQGSMGSELYNTNPKEWRKVSFETLSIIKVCSPEIIANNYKSLTKPLERVKAIKELSITSR